MKYNLRYRLVHTLTIANKALVTLMMTAPNDNLSSIRDPLHEQVHNFALCIRRILLFGSKKTKEETGHGVMFIQFVHCGDSYAFHGYHS